MAPFLAPVKSQYGAARALGAQVGGYRASIARQGCDGTVKNAKVGRYPGLGLKVARGPWKTLETATLLTRGKIEGAQDRIDPRGLQPEWRT